MDHGLGVVFAALTEDLSLGLRTYSGWLTTFYNSSSWDLTASSGLHRHLNSGAYSHRQRQAIKHFFKNH